MGLRPPRLDLDLVALERAERGDLRQTSGRDEPGARRAIAQPDLGVEGAHRLHDERRRSRVQAVRQRHREHPRCLAIACGLRRSGLVDVRFGVFFWRCQVGLLGRQRRHRFGRDLGRGGARVGGHRGDDQPLDERRRAQHDAAAAVVVQEVQGELGRQDRAAEIHQHDDPVALIRSTDGVLDGDGVGPEGAVVEPGGDLDGRLTTVQHLGGQCHGGVRERPAVGDHHDADGHGSKPDKASAAAAISSAADVAPGSWCPTLRSPR